MSAFGSRLPTPSSKQLRPPASTMSAGGARPKRPVSPSAGATGGPAGNAAKRLKPEAKAPGASKQGFYCTQLIF